MNKIVNKQNLFRVCIYLAGLLILAFGVYFAVRANLGISPVSSPSRAMFVALQTHLPGDASAAVPYVVLNLGGWAPHITYGTCVNFIYILYVIVQIIILRREFKIVNLLQLVVSTVFGYFVDFAGWTLSFLFPVGFNPAYPVKLLLLAVSILLIAVGISFYLGAKLLPMASEGMGLAITAKLKKHPYHKVKMVIDVFFVLMAVLIMLIFTGALTYVNAKGVVDYVVREGTVVTALVVGPVMGLLKPLIDPLIQRVCFKNAKKPDAPADDAGAPKAKAAAAE